MLRAKGEKPFRVWNFRVAGLISGLYFRVEGLGFKVQHQEYGAQRLHNAMPKKTHQEINLEDAKMKIKKRNLDL